MRKLNLPLLGCLLGLSVVPARADIIFSTATGDCLIANCQNILFQASSNTGNPLDGVTTTTNNIVRFTTPGANILVAPSSGQARVEQQQANFTNLSFTLPGAFFGEALFNINSFTGDPDDVATITAVDNEGTTFTSANFALANGENRFRVQAINNESIANISIAISSGAMQDVRQFRIGGVAAAQNEPPGAIPEPGSMALMGAGMMGLGLYLRRVRR